MLESIESMSCLSWELRLSVFFCVSAVCVRVRVLIRVFVFDATLVRLFLWHSTPPLNYVDIYILGTSFCALLPNLLLVHTGTAFYPSLPTTTETVTTTAV